MNDMILEMLILAEVSSKDTKRTIQRKTSSPSARTSSGIGDFPK